MNSNYRRPKDSTADLAFALCILSRPLRGLQKRFKEATPSTEDVEPNRRCSSPREKIDIINVFWTMMIVVQELRRAERRETKEFSPILAA